MPLTEKNKFLCHRDTKIFRTVGYGYECDYCLRICSAKRIMVGNRTLNHDICIRCLSDHYKTIPYPLLLTKLPLNRRPLWEITRAIPIKWNNGVCRCVSCKNVCCGSIYLDDSHLCFRCLCNVDGLY